MRCQVDRAIGSGIDVTHLDAHMGAALIPELLVRTCAWARLSSAGAAAARRRRLRTSLHRIGHRPRAVPGRHPATRRGWAELWSTISAARPGAPSEQALESYRAMVRRSAARGDLHRSPLHRARRLRDDIPGARPSANRRVPHLPGRGFGAWATAEGFAVTGMRPLRDLLRSRLAAEA